MKDCTHCKHARWERTKAGRLHPSGNGMCGIKDTIQMPPLPASMRWPLSKPFGGQINRHEDLRTDCTFYEPRTRELGRTRGELARELREAALDRMAEDAQRVGLYE